METTRQNPIFIVESFKGGVGKSMVAISLIEYCKARNIPVSIVDTDSMCHDVERIYRATEQCHFIDLEEKDGGGWLKLADIAENNPETLVVNMKTDSYGSTVNNRQLISGRLMTLKRPVNLFFVMGIQNLSVSQLNNAIELYPDANLVVAVKNLKNGLTDEFFNYDTAKKNGNFENVRDIYFPRLHARISLKISEEGMAISKLLECNILKIAERAALTAWIDNIFSKYDSIIPFRFNIINPLSVVVSL